MTDGARFIGYVCCILYPLGVLAVGNGTGSGAGKSSGEHLDSKTFGYFAEDIGKTLNPPKN